MQPYYADDKAGITIYHGDCRALTLPEKPALVLADPPYGMGLDTDYGNSTTNTERGIIKSRGYAPVVGDDEPYDPTPIFEQCRGVKEQFWWGADYYRKYLPDGGSWFTWDKRAGLPEFDYSSAEFELCWSKTAHQRSIARIRWFGAFGMEREGGARRVHPTQKPVALMRWCIQRAKLAPGALVYDPYMGSGPIAQACKELGYRYIGVELVERYCDIAARRLQQEVMELV